MLLLFYILLNILPPINNIYKGLISLPLIGKHIIKYERINKKTSKISLSGIINSEGYVKYKNEYNISDCIIDKNLEILMNKFSCKINKLEYLEDEDITKMYLDISAIHSSKIVILKNIHKKN